jgi:hypothetical protein
MVQGRKGKDEWKMEVIKRKEMQVSYKIIDFSSMRWVGGFELTHRI